MLPFVVVFFYYQLNDLAEVIPPTGKDQACQWIIKVIAIYSLLRIPLQWLSKLFLSVYDFRLLLNKKYYFKSSFKFIKKRYLKQVSNNYYRHFSVTRSNKSQT